MSEYKPNPLSAVFVWVSCLIFVVVPGIYGVLVYEKFFQAVTGIGANDGLSLLFVICFVAIPMLVALTLGVLVGGIAWTLLINIILPIDAVRYWADYPAPHIPVLTPAFDRLNEFILNLRSRREENKRS